MALKKEVIISDKAPKAVGPYSLGIRVRDVIYTAGQVGLDASTGKLVGDSIEEQTHQVLQNLKSVLEAAGSGLDRVVKTTVFMADLGKLPAHECGLRRVLHRGTPGAQHRAGGSATAWRAG